MRQVWPFAPLTPVIESLEWATDVFRARAAEQRIALRTIPRRTFNLNHILSDHEYNYARQLIRAAQSDGGFYAPDWAQSSVVGSVSSGSGVSLPLPENTDIGDRVMLWQSSTHYESVEVVEDSNGLTGDVVNSYTAARLVPLWEADAPAGLEVDRGGAQINRASIELITYEGEDLSASDYPQYRGHDVMTTCPVLGSSTFAESVIWPSTNFDNTTGVPEYIRSRTTPDMAFTMRWHEFSRASLWELRQWLHARKGRQKVFWLSSRGHDLEPAASISGTTITVFNDILARADVFDIDVTDKSGNASYRRVTNAAAGSAVNGRPTVDLTIDSSITVNLSEIRRISYLRCARFDADRIELEHQASGGTSVVVPCIEVPTP